MKLLFFTSLISLALASSGCGKDPASAIGETTQFNFTMRDPATDEDVHRMYEVNVPANYDPNTKYPVVLWFHGWYNVEELDTPFVDVGQKNGAITVYPLGYDDEADGPGRNSWNVGDANSTLTCTSMTSSVCYKSCKKLN